MRQAPLPHQVLPLEKRVVPGPQEGSREPNAGAEAVNPGESRKVSEKLLGVLRSSHTTCPVSSETQFPPVFHTHLTLSCNS